MKGKTPEFYGLKDTCERHKCKYLLHDEIKYLLTRIYNCNYVFNRFIYDNNDVNIA